MKTLSTLSLAAAALAFGLGTASAAQFDLEGNKIVSDADLSAPGSLSLSVSDVHQIGYEKDEDGSYFKTMATDPATFATAAGAEPQKQMRRDTWAPGYMLEDENGGYVK